MKKLMSNSCNKTSILLNTAEIVENKRPTKLSPLRWSSLEQRIKMNEDPWKTSKKEKDEIVLVKITDVSFFAIFKSVIIFLLVCFIVLPVIIFFITVVLGLSLGNLL